MGRVGTASRHSRIEVGTAPRAVLAYSFRVAGGGPGWRAAANTHSQILKGKPETE